MVAAAPDNNLTGVDETRLYAVMSYLFVLVLVPLLTRRNDPFVFFHAKQGLVISLGFVLAVVATFWSSAAGSVLFLLLLTVDVLALVQALLGRRWQIPVIGALAQRFTL